MRRALIGKVWTGDAGRPWAGAVVWEEQRIVYVGEAEGVGAWRPGWVESCPGVILPGLADAHAHLLSMGLMAGQADLRGCRGFGEVVERLRGREGGWLLGRGWDHNGWPEAGFPGRAALDAEFPGVPIVLTRVDGHALLASGAALRAAGITSDTPEPAGGQILRDESGEPTGLLIDNAMELLRVPEPSMQRRMEALELAMRQAAAAGLTSVHDMGNDAETILAMRRLAEAGRMPIRVYALAMTGTQAEAELLECGPQPELGGRLTVRGVKFMADGALGSRGAALEEAYCDHACHRGLLLLEPEELEQRVSRAAAAGLQPSVHAIGDRANRIVLDCFAHLRNTNPRVKGRGALRGAGAEPLQRRALPAPTKGLSPSGLRLDFLRPRIEHAQILRLEDLSRFAELGVIASMQPLHATGDMPWAETRLGAARLRGAYAWRGLLERGARLAFGSDFPIESHRPLLGLHAAITRQDAQGHPPGGWLPQERLSLPDALAAFTSGAAYAAFEEPRLGTIAVGRAADLTAISVDPWSTPPEALLSAEVLWTVVGGDLA